jgi:hypothetical protein
LVDLSLAQHFLRECLSPPVKTSVTKVKKPHAEAEKISFREFCGPKYGKKICTDLSFVPCDKQLSALKQRGVNEKRNVKITYANSIAASRQKGANLTRRETAKNLTQTGRQNVGGILAMACPLALSHAADKRHSFTIKHRNL